MPGPLALVASLAAVTGCLDAVCLARLTHTFVGFQTGNTVLVGLGLGRGHYENAAGPAVAVLAYLLGSVATPAVLRRGSPSADGVVRRLLTIAAGLLVATAAIVLIGAGANGARPTGALRYVVIVVSAVAMAAQTPAVRRVHDVAVSSTFSSGMLTRLGHSLGSLRDPVRRERERIVARVLGVTIACFVAGAGLGGVALVAIGNAAVVLPALGLVAVAAAVTRRRVSPHSA
jgi:uncharacterized membrane protein YoaK (UPF0700 family)